MKSKGFIAILTVFALLLLPIGSLAGVIVTVYISTAEDIAKIQPDSICVLENDIVLTGNHTPIGTRSAPFTGFFDGQGHTISGISIDSLSDNIGFFGAIDDAVIRNLRVEGNISGGNNVGGIAGRSENSIIVRCQNACTISGGNCIGGITGLIPSTTTSGSVEECFNAGTITTRMETGRAGGIVGSAQSSTTIRDCFNLGKICGGQNCYAGGISGYLQSNATVKCCYNAGRICNSVNSTATAGTTTSTGLISCYYLDNLWPSTVKTGTALEYSQLCTELPGFDFESIWELASGEYKYPSLKENPISFTKTASDVVITNKPSQTIYTLTSMPTQVNTAGLAVSLHYNDGTSKVLTSSEYSVANCNFDLGAHYIKVTASECETTFCIIVLRHSQDATAVPEGYIPIYSRQNFADIAMQLSASYILMDNIDLSDEPWKPLGSITAPFSGIILGNNFSCSGLSVNADVDYSGIFGYCENATIKNLNISGAVSGKNYVGTVAGYALNSFIEGCISDVSVIGADYMGGICGKFEATRTDQEYRIFSCVNKGTVSSASPLPNSTHMGGICGAISGKNASIVLGVNLGKITAVVSSLALVGGICGDSFSSTIDKCRNSADISTTAPGTPLYCGGIVGSLAGQLSNSFNTGAVSATANSPLATILTGGICGIAYATPNGNTTTKGKLSYCYNVGNVSASSGKKSICGELDGGTAENCYYLNSTPLDASSVALSAANMTVADSFVDFDFTSVWEFSKTYPYPVIKGDEIAISGITAAISGSISFSGIIQAGNTLTADVSLLKPAGATYSLQWVRDNLPISGATSAEYKVTAEDENAFLGLRVTGTNLFSGSLIGFADEKNAPVVPKAPVVSSKTTTSITLTATSGYEYKKGDGQWQDSNVFDNLESNTEYSFYQRIKATASLVASPSSTALVVKTNKIAVKLGDLDESGEVDDWDGVLFARYLAGWTVTIADESCMDIDGDNEIGDWDGVLLDRHLAGWTLDITFE